MPQLANRVAQAHLDVPTFLLEQSAIEMFQHTRTLEASLPAHEAQPTAGTANEKEEKQDVIESIVSTTKDELQQWLEHVHPSLYPI